MKIISGIYKGRNLLGHDLKGTRPTMDRVKESLFAMIQFEINDSIILDLFAGSGNLGIECISMNAKKAYFVDYNKKATETIKNNLKNIQIESEKYKILNLDYIKSLKYCEENNLLFNIIFLDPPYKTDYIEKSINIITKYNLLHNNGLVICESDDLKKIIYDEEKYLEIKSKKYGDKYIVILKKKWYNLNHKVSL